MELSHSSPRKNDAPSLSSKSFSFVLKTRSLVLFQTALKKLLFFAFGTGFLLSLPMQQASAETEQLIFEVRIDHPLEHREMISQAEQEAKRLISQRFLNSSDTSSLQVSALLHRNGEVIPMFITTISREQWQQSAQISPWTKYHNSYALLRRHTVNQGQATIVAVAPVVPSSTIIADLGRYESAFDRGRLSSEFVQGSLDRWD